MESLKLWNFQLGYKFLDIIYKEGKVMKQGTVLNVFLILCCIVATACSGESQKENSKGMAKASKNAVFEGVIARKWTEHAPMILVIHNISDEKLMNGTPDELIDIASEDGNGMIFYVSEEEYEKSEIGQKVSISHSGMAQESLPPKTGADDIELLGD
jgi:hypothetical protein